jgi:U3 small nucleolar RNA-associated protein 12
VTELSFLPTPSEADAADVPSTSAGRSSGSTHGHLLSVSKDGLLKLWDLGLQHCIETLVPGKGELLSLALARGVSPDVAGEEQAMSGTLFLTGSAEGEVRIWQVSNEALAAGLQVQEDVLDAEDKPKRFISALGTLPIAAARRVTQMAFSPLRSASNATRFLAVSSTDRGVQVFRLRTAEDMRKKMARRLKRAKEKGDKRAGENGAAGEAQSQQEMTWADRLESYTTVRPTAGRVRSFAFADDVAHSSTASKSGATPLLLALSSNAVEVHNLPAPPRSKAEKASAPEAALACGIDLPGHRSEVRALALSSDDTLLASADSAGLLKVWNVKTGRCVRTLPCGYALSVAWLPDDRHVLVGCKDGTLRSYDVPAGEVLETIEAHAGPIWSVALNPDGLSCVTASADKEVKFWEFESRAPEAEAQPADDAAPAPPARPQLALAHVRTLKMTDDVLFARYSPDGRLLALSLLDCTVKVFYADSLKFFLSLYGHKLPVLSLDISSDSKLCVTVSADRNAKLWGLDYGDCHRSLYAHEEAVMSCAFERGSQGGGLLGGREGASHHFWTVGRDGKLKHWDGDRFELIQTLEGHHGEVWAVAAGRKGTLAVTAGADRSIRVWEKTDEPLFLEEEREKELERAFEGGAETGRNDEGAIGSLAEGAEPQVQQDDAAAVSKTTKDTLIAGERLMEALDLADADLAAVAAFQQAGAQGAPPARSPVLVGAFGPDEEPDAHRYVLKVTERIPAAQLEDSLLVLPFDKVVSLMRQLDHWARKVRCTQRGQCRRHLLTHRTGMVYAARGAHSLLPAPRAPRSDRGEPCHARHAHFAAWALTCCAAPPEGESPSRLRADVVHGLTPPHQTTIGFNLAALRYVRAQHVAQKTSDLYEKEGLDMDEDAVRARIEEGQKRKRKLAVA